MHERLSSKERSARIITLAALISTATFVRAIEPTLLGTVWPLHTSCGAITGLPCIFCGGTRALHFLLNGDFSRALYFNWLAFPVAAAALAICGLFAAELGRGTKFVDLRVRVSLTLPKIGAIAAGLILLWSLQVYLAVSGQKTELLNPRGPLYALFVR